MLSVQAQERQAMSEPARLIMEQALVAREENDSSREFEILEQGIQAIGAENPASFRLYQRLGEFYADRGNVYQAIRVVEMQQKTVRSPSQEFIVRVKLASLYPNLYQMEKAKVAAQNLRELMVRLRATPGWQKLGSYWQAGAALAGATYQTRAGHLEQAEAGWRACLSFASNHLAENPEHAGAQFYLVDCTSGLLGALVAAGKLAEAGAVVAQQRAEIEKIAQVARRPAMLPRVAASFGRVALALANPQLTGDTEDGMLTMEEVLGLRLRADWVVLSACNKAASDGAVGGAESFSGLGRAFFFAGARALLVTSWAVETESARMLTTDIFKRQLDQPGLSRSLALQQASMALMKKSAGKEYSYAHPMFWAPYVLVGDGS